MGLFVRCGVFFWEPLELLKGVKPQSSCEGKCGSALGSLQGNQASSRVEGRISWFFLSCCQKLRDPLKLHRRPQGTSRVATVESDLLSSCKGHLGIPFQSLQGNSASS